MNFGPDGDKSLNGGSILLNLPKRFWITFIGAVGVLLFTLFDWFSVSIVTKVSFNFNLFMMVLRIAMLLVFILLIISLITHQSKAGLVFAYCGFGLAALVSIIFIGKMFFEGVTTMLLVFILLIISLIIHQSKAGLVFAYCGFGLAALVSISFIVKMPLRVVTIFPFLTCVYAIVALESVRLEDIKLGFLSTFLNTMLLTFSLTCIFPLVWMFYSALKIKRDFNADIIGLPKAPTLSNYIRIMINTDYHIWESMFNSARSTLLSVILIVAFGFIVGYILCRVSFLGNRIVYAMFLMGMLMPIHSLMVPIYVVFKGTGLNNHWYTLIIPYVAFGLPIAVFLVEGFVKSIPTALEEAAAIDGSSFSRTLLTIVLPICRPILTTIAIIQTFACWNEFAFALILLRDVQLQTVPLAMKQFTGQFSSDYPKIMAAMVLTMSPILLLYFLFSKQIIKGMVAGAVKG